MEAKNKKFMVKATCEVVFYIPIEAKNQKEAEKVAKIVDLGSDFDSSDYNFDGELCVQEVYEISQVESGATRSTGTGLPVLMRQTTKGAKCTTRKKSDYPKEKN